MSFTKSVIETLEIIWGDGFLSPGGLPELQDWMGPEDIAGLNVLDIGCGVGGYSIGLIKDHGVRHVLGIDICPLVVQRAARRAKLNGLTERASFVLVDPGPIPLADCSFDVVFSKDSFIAIHNKPYLFGEVQRLLRPHGRLLCSDWLAGDPPSPGTAMSTWLESIPDKLELLSAPEMKALLQNNGFGDVEILDTSEQAVLQTTNEYALVSEQANAQFVELLGPMQTDSLVARTSLRLQAIMDGCLVPSRIKATKGR